MNKIVISLMLAVLMFSEAQAQNLPGIYKSQSEYNKQPYANSGYNESNTQTKTVNITPVNLTKAEKAAAKSILDSAIRKYKSENYIGAMQALENVTAKDPANALAHYYLAMTYVHIGQPEWASAEYDAVIALNPNSELAKNANIGKANLSGTNATPNANSQSGEIIAEPDRNKPVKDFYSNDVKEKIQEKTIKTIIENVNNNRQTDPAIYKRIESLEPKKSSNETPSQEQIAEAMQILTKAGMNPVNPYMASNQVNQINPEMMQMNMLMSAFGSGGNNNNSMSNMMPMLMMMQNGQGSSKIDPETMQVMMSQMMMPGMMNLYENNNNNY